MKKFRTYKNYTLVYDLEREQNGFVFSIEKNSASGVEKSSYMVFGAESELKGLLCRLWRCGVTPMSLVYILEDEGYLPKPVENEKSEMKPMVHIVRRKRKDMPINTNSPFVLDNRSQVALCCELDDKEM